MAGKVELRNQNTTVREGDKIIRAREQWIGMAAFITKLPRSSVATSVAQKTAVAMLAQKVGTAQPSRAPPAQMLRHIAHARAHTSPSAHAQHIQRQPGVFAAVVESAQ